MDKNNLPNFLIIGAAKAGTTSLHNYLNANNSIFMSRPKEPKVFSYLANKTSFNGPGDDAVLKNIIKSINDYSCIFETSTPFSMKGESSADYLYYFKDVIPLIKIYLGNPKIIILLRNPVERAFSAYTHLRRDNRETLSFERALSSEEKRIIEGYEFIWHYKKTGLYFEQVKSYLENFSEVKVLLFEDLKMNAQKIVDDACAFLNTSSQKIRSGKIYNKSGIPKKNWKTNFYSNIVQSDNTLKTAIKKVLPSNIREMYGKKLKERLFENNLEKPEFKSETRQLLIEYYREDIIKLQELINRDLTNWLK